MRKAGKTEKPLTWNGRRKHSTAAKTEKPLTWRNPSPPELSRWEKPFTFWRRGSPKGETPHPLNVQESGMPNAPKQRNPSLFNGLMHTTPKQRNLSPWFWAALKEKPLTCVRLAQTETPPFSQGTRELSPKGEPPDLCTMGSPRENPHRVGAGLHEQHSLIKTGRMFCVRFRNDR
jgi:hypothetical protein